VRRSSTSPLSTIAQNAADWLEGSLVEPEPPDRVTAFFERHAGRGA